MFPEIPGQGLAVGTTSPDYSVLTFTSDGSCCFEAFHPLCPTLPHPLRVRSIGRGCRLYEGPCHGALSDTNNLYRGNVQDDFSIIGLWSAFVQNITFGYCVCIVFVFVLSLKDGCKLPIVIIAATNHL